MLPRLTYRVKYATMQKTSIASTIGIVRKGHTPSSAPALVATPLPPLNFRKTLKTCPKIAAQATSIQSSVAVIVVAENPSAHPAKSVGNIPLSRSSVNTIAKYFPPSNRPTLVAPILRLPAVRGSTPRVNPTSNPNGVDPARYASGIRQSSMLVGVMDDSAAGSADTGKHPPPSRAIPQPGPPPARTPAGKSYWARSPRHPADAYTPPRSVSPPASSNLPADGRRCRLPKDTAPDRCPDWICNSARNATDLIART